MRQSHSQLFKFLWPLSNKFPFSRFHLLFVLGGEGDRGNDWTFLNYLAVFETSNQWSFLSTVSWTLVDGLFVKHFGSFLTKSKKGKVMNVTGWSKKDTLTESSSPRKDTSTESILVIFWKGVLWCVWVLLYKAFMNGFPMIIAYFILTCGLWSVNNFWYCEYVISDASMF